LVLVVFRGSLKYYTYMKLSHTSPVRASLIISCLGFSTLAAAVQVIPYAYESNRTPGGNSWYVDNGYTGSTGGGLSGGVGELVDGVKGSLITSGYSQWYPYSLIDVGGGPADITYTYFFDQTYEWDGIIQYQQIFHRAAVYQPGSFDIEFSIDGGASYHSTVTRLMSEDENAVTQGAVAYSLLGTATGYYADTIKITLHQDRRWTATDEVEFFGTAVDSIGVIPEPSAFTVLLSLALFAGVASKRSRRG
jgi:hypothetical protein